MPPKLIHPAASLALDRLDDALAKFASTSRSRGIRYQRDGAVGALKVRSGEVRADVMGTRLYDVAWTYNGRTWRPECDCPVGPRCKHAYALADELIEEVLADPQVDEIELQLLLGSAVQSHSASDTGAKPRSGQGIRQQAPRSVVPARADAISELRTASSVGGRLDAVARLTRESGLFEPMLDLDHFFAERDAIDPDSISWTVAQGFARANAGRVPEPLQPYLERADLADRAAEKAAEIAKHALAQWVSRPAARSQKSIRLVLGIAPARKSEFQITLEPRVTSAKLKDATRTLEQLRQMYYNVRNSAERLTDPEARLLEALVATGDQERALAFQSTLSEAQQSPVAMLLNSQLPSPLVRWDLALNGPGYERFGLLGGEVVRFDHRPFTLVPALEAEPGGGARIVAVMIDGDGRRVPTADTMCFAARVGSTSERLQAALHDGVLRPLQTPLPDDLAQRLLAANSIVLDHSEAPTFARALRRQLPASVADDALARHPVRLVVTLELDEDADSLHLRVLGLSPDLEWPPPAALTPGSRVFELHSDGEWAFAADFTSEELDRSWLEQPAPQGLDSLLAWFESAGFKHARTAQDHAFGLILLGPASLDRLAEAWTHKPEHVEWLGDAAALALFEQRKRLRARVQAKRSGVDLLEVSVEWDAEMLSLSDDEIARLRAARTPWVRLGAGWVRRDIIEPMDDALAALAELGLEPGAGAQQLSLWQLAQVRPEALAQLEAHGIDAESLKAIQHMRKRVASFRGLPRVATPKGLRGRLRPYQREGLAFLAWTSSLGLGAVLADDMGLGKTIQALAWLLHLRARDATPRPALVACPASVVHNWEREAHQFAPSLRVQVLSSGTERHEQLRSLADHDLLITNYALLRRDADEWQKHDLLAVIADEAQMIKNPSAAISKTMCGLKAQHRLALTGTPLENRALDLWSIIRFVNPGYLGSEREFLSRFDRVDAPPHARRLLSAKLRPMLLRRLKRDVAPELPERIEERRDCEMPADQRKLYLDELRRARAELAMLAAEGGVRKHKIQILACLTRLRQICCHPGLVGARASVASGKFDALFELLEPLLAEGHKVLVFSQFVRALELVQQRLRPRGIRHHLLTGATKDRAKVVRDFENDTEACVFLISLRAGGTGLNLTAASYVVLLDPWWNPAVEAQAIDRTHRIGQDKTVIAYRLLMKGTIEERIWELQQRKAALASDVLGEDGFAKTLDREALEYLFAPES